MYWRRLKMMTEYDDPKYIWLEPGCVSCSIYERTWCINNVYEPCEECGRKPAKYQLVEVEDAP